jgi:C-terminal processing protease CtpA/Prc
LAEASNGWLETLNATHTGRFTLDQTDCYELAEIFRRAIRNRNELFPPEGVVTYPGIGMVPRTIEGKLFVAYVYDGGPAARAGVKVGDEIVSVDGEPYAPIAAFQGKVGQVVNLRVRRDAGAAPLASVDLFVGRSPLVELTDRDGDEHVANARWDKPLVGIIDEGSRSGMEILAHGLKQASVPLVGTRTAGAVVAGRAFRLRDNSLLEVAVLDVHVDGARLEGKGVSPDVAPPFDIRHTAGADPQLDRALEAMRGILAGPSN